jgi:molybdopterin molybdotransferase
LDGLLSVTEAQQRLLAAFMPVKAVRISLAHTVGRVLAEGVFSPMDLPPFPNSTVDGFAVRTRDVEPASRERPVLLEVVGDIAAGQVVELTVESGQAARIMTGAPLPTGADGVVAVEETDFNVRQPGFSAPERVNIYRPVQPGGNVRPRGQDVRGGQQLIEAGVRLRPQDVALLAMIGIARVAVFRRPRVALLSTGDELVPVGEPLQPGKIFDSNAQLLAALVEQAGGIPLKLGIAADKAESVEKLLDRAAEARADLILSSAGVSVGAFDFVRSVVEKNGRLDFWRVNMRPGKPLAFGQYRKVPFIGLPGNPVSAYAGFEVFVRPALMRLSGIKAWNRPIQKVQAAEPLESDGRESYLRGVVQLENGQLSARLTGHQGSGNLFSLVQANALLIVPSGVKSLPVGAEVDAWMLDLLSPGK